MTTDYDVWQALSQDDRQALSEDACWATGVFDATGALQCLPALHPDRHMDYKRDCHKEYKCNVIAALMLVPVTPFHDTPDHKVSEELGVPEYAVRFRRVLSNQWIHTRDALAKMTALGRGEPEEGLPFVTWPEMKAIATKYGVLNIRHDLPLECGGVLLPKFNTPARWPRPWSTILIDSELPPRERRFTLAHELGHMLWEDGIMLADEVEADGLPDIG